MNFPLSKIDIKEYQDEIYELIIDEECHLYIDTNIIALFYGIHDSARKEFFDWLQGLIEKNRVNIPVWVINEYTNRFIRNKIQDYLSPLKKVTTLKNEFSQVSAFLKMHVEDSNLPKNKYLSLLEFQNDLKEIEEKLEKIAFTAINKDDKYKLKIHNEIKQILGNCIMDSNIDDILTKINQLGLIRYNHKLPPGFQDDKKDLNAHGDLILWYEILEHCRNKNIKKAILVTNDEKKDWVYAPNKLIINSKEKNNLGPQLKIADPRLVHEFKIFTNSERFYIITFDFLIQVLIEKLGSSFTNIASALQLVYNQSNVATMEEQNSTEIININDINEIDSLSEQTGQLPKSEEEIKEVQLENIIQIDNKSVKLYSDYALSDRDFPLIDNTFFTQVIDQLKSHNWYKQNPAIDEFLKFDSNSIKESQTISDSLFVIGRNIYQSACGGSTSAIDFIKSMRHKFSRFNDYFINHLYSGIMYEIYFDSANNFRGDKLKSYFFNETFSLYDLSRLNPSFDFIKSVLTPFESQLLFVPFKSQEVIIELVFDENLIEVNNWTGKTSYLQLISLKCNNREMLTDLPDEGLDIYYSNPYLKGLTKLICETYAIPFSFVQIKINPEIKNDIHIMIGNKKLATTRCHPKLGVSG